jgi:hypothetical protein
LYDVVVNKFFSSVIFIGIISGVAIGNLGFHFSSSGLGAEE